MEKIIRHAETANARAGSARPERAVSSALVFASTLLSASAAMAQTLPPEPAAGATLPSETAAGATLPSATAAGATLPRATAAGATLPTVAAPEPPPGAIDVGPPPIAGWNGSFFIRDPKDYFRIYPKMRIAFDFQNYFGPGVGKVTAANGGNSYASRFFLRRMDFELGGEFMKRWTFYGAIEIVQGITNPTGTAELTAAPVGQNPSADTARFQPTQTAGFTVAPDDVLISFTVFPWLQFSAGQVLAPFSMENRTGNKYIPFMERSMGIRSFVLHSSQELGLTVWGEAFDKKLNYEVGIFGGEGSNRPQLDKNVDWIGRVYARPLLSCKCALKGAHIGMSARHGERDAAYIGYDYAPVTSGQGVRLWNPQYKDSFGRQIHVIPSGAQNQIGGELKLPVSKFELRSEAYYVANNTREAVEGYQLTNSERFGQVRGVGWYVQLSAWPFGDAFVNGDLGVYRPTRLDLTKEPAMPKRGLEVLALIGGVNGSYDGSSRSDSTGQKSPYDAKTPGNPVGGVGKDITVLQYGVGLSYWYSNYVRTSVNYIAYHTPGSGSTDNLAAVPGNSVMDTSKTAHLLHELGFRVQVGF